MAIVLTVRDQQELDLKHPTLNCSLSRKAVWGTLSFACSYDSLSKELVHENTESNYIQDNYEIRIDFNEFDTFGFPKVYEESGKILNFADRKKVKLEDLHINTHDKNSVCLGIFPEYSWDGVSRFIRDKITPFFYWQSYRRVYGTEPWEGYAHDVDGIFQAMALQPKNISKGRYRNINCPCGSGLKYKKCCMKRDILLKDKLLAYLKSHKQKK